MVKRTIAAFALAAGLGAASLASAPAASAAPSDCNAGALCAYWLPNYTNASGHGVQRVYQNNDNLTMYGNFYNSEGGSAFNNGTQCNVVVYTGTSGTGSGWELNRGTGWTTIYSNVPHIESNYWCTY